MIFIFRTNSNQTSLRNRFKLWAAAAVTVSALIDHNSAYATTATWNGTSDSNWATGADWSDGSAPGSTTSTTSSDTAIFNNAGANHTSIAVDSNRNIDDIIFDTSNTASYTFNGGSLLGTNAGQIVMNSTVTSSQTFDSSLSIEGTKSSFELTNNSANPSATLNYAGTIQAPAGGTVHIDGSNTGQNTIGGAITGSMNVVESGTGTWIMSGNDTYSGQTYVTSGTLAIPSTFNETSGRLTSDGGIIQVSGTVANVGTTADYGGELLLNGSGQLTGGTVDVQDGGYATFDNSATLLNNRLNGNGLGMWGGTFNYISGNGPSTEQLGAITALDGANIIQLNPNALGSTIVTATSINRSPFTTATNPTLLVVGKNMGAIPGAGNTTLVVNSSGTTAPEIGGAGAAGTTNISIENLAVIQDLALSGNAQYGLVTGIGSANGLRALSSSEYANSITDSLDSSATLRNINLTNTSTVKGSTTTINALRLDTGGAVNGTGALTINSGAILALPGNGGIGVADLNFGSEEAIFHTFGNLTVSSVITGSGGLTKTGPGTLYLSSGNAVGYTGNTAVNQGILRFGATNQFANSGTFTLSGGSVDLNGFNQTLELTTGQFDGSGSSVINSNANPTATLTIHQSGISSINTYQGVIGASGAANISLNVDMGTSALYLTHSSSYTGATTISSGALVLDFSAPDSTTNNILPSTSHVDCGGEILSFAGLSTGTQTFNGITMEPGPGFLIQQGPDMAQYPALLLPLAQVQDNLGLLTHNVGDVANLFPLAVANSSGFTTTTTNTNGIIGGWATINGQDWAVANGANDISALASYTSDAWSPGANVTVTTNSTQTNATANSLRFSNAAAYVVTISGTNTLSSGGVLVAQSVGNNLSKIQGGVLKGAAGADLVASIFNPGTSSGLEIDSIIADNTSATALTETGGGNLILTGANTYTGGTYLDDGTIAISSDANLGAPVAAAPVYLESGGTLSVSGSLALENGGSNPRPIVVGGYGGSINIPTSDTLTVNGLMSGSSLGKLNLTNSGTLLLTNSGNTFAGTLTNGILQLGSATAAQDMTVSTNLVFNAGIGQFTIGALSGYSSLYMYDVTAGPITLTVGGNNQSTQFEGNLQPYGGLYKVGTGNFSLYGNIYDYPLYLHVNGGSVSFNGSAVVTSNSIVTNNASLIFNINASNSNFIVAGSGTTTIASGVSMAFSNFTQGGLVNNGSVQVTGNGTVGAITGNGSLTLGTGSSVNTLHLATNSALSTMNSLAINAGSTLDLANNHLIINYGSGADPIASIRQYLVSGYAAGAWNGAGIDSSSVAANSHYGVGYADGADGVVAGLSSGQIEIKYTLLGDANLDGVVSGDDFTILTGNLGKSVSGWDKGDFNYDGLVTGDDFTLLTGNLGKSDNGTAVVLPASDYAAIDAFAAANGFIADVPEPTMGSMLLFAGVGILMPRRQKPSI